MTTSPTDADALGEYSLLAPKYHEGIEDLKGDVGLMARAFTYDGRQGKVAGTVLTVMCTIDRPAKDVWPHFKDFNLWQEPYHNYTDEDRGLQVLGEMYSEDDRSLGAAPFRLTRPDGSFSPNRYVVLTVIPEYLVVLYQPVNDDPLLGGVSGGKHVFLLNEHGGKTIMTGVMEHALRLQDKSEEDWLSEWHASASEGVRKWRDEFIPKLKQLVYAAP